MVSPKNYINTTQFITTLKYWCFLAWLSVNATKEGTAYIGSYAVCCPVVPGKAKASYEDGLLKVTVPYKAALEDAVDVMIE